MTGTIRAKTGVQAAFDKKTLFRAIDDARKLQVFKGSVAETAKFLIRFIPEGADTPISPVRVSRAADELMIDVRTVRRHVNLLVHLGFAANKTLDGGHRVAYRKLDGISYIAGIDFTPLLNAAEQLTQGVDEFEAELRVKQRLCARISTMRRDIRTALERVPGAAHAFTERFTALPRKIAALAIDSIEDLFSAVEELWNDIESFKSTEMSDQSDSNVRLYTTSKNSFGKSNRSPIKKAKENLERDLDGLPQQSASQERPPEQNEGVRVATEQTDTPEILTNTKLLLEIAPQAWKDDLLDFNDNPGWDEFRWIAKHRASANGIWPEKFDELVDHHGLPIICFLMILIDHDGPTGRGMIKKPVGWMLEMHKRLNSGTANLTKSLFGLMNRINPNG